MNLQILWQVYIPGSNLHYTGLFHTSMTFTFTKNNTIVLSSSKYLQPNTLASWYVLYVFIPFYFVIYTYLPYILIFYTYFVYFILIGSSSCIVNNRRGYSNWWEISRHFRNINQSTVDWIDADDIKKNNLYLDNLDNFNNMDTTSTSTTMTTTSTNNNNGNQDEMSTENTEINFRRQLLNSSPIKYKLLADPNDFNQHSIVDNTNIDRDQFHTKRRKRRMDLLPSSHSTVGSVDKDEDTEEEGVKLSVTLLSNHVVS